MLADGRAEDGDVVKRAAALWNSADDIGAEESRKAVCEYRVSEMRNSSSHSHASYSRF